MKEFPTGFLYVMLGVIAAAVVLVFLAYAWKQHKLNRLQNPHRDFYRKRG